MKARTLIFIIIILLFYACDNRATTPTESSKVNKGISGDSLNREELTTFRTFDKREILKRLFDNPLLDSQGMAVWKGNYSDLTSLSIPLSYDDKFHTSLDTILYFVDTKNRNCAVTIFSTYNFQHDPFDISKIRPTGCHFCGVPIGAALFHQNDKKNWELYDFKKEITHLGYFGIYKTGRQDEGKIQLKEIGDRWTCLSVTEGLGGNMGYLEGSETLFSVDEYKLDGSPNNTLKKLLANYYNIKEIFLSKKILPEIKPIKTQSNCYDLLVRTIDDETVKTKTFKYSPDCDQYLEQMH